MFSILEQFSAAAKTHYERQLATINALSCSALEGATKVIDLNLNVVKVSLEESAIAAKQLLSAKNPQEWFSLTAAHAQPNVEKALAYGRHVAAIASSTQVELTKAAEAHIAETKHKVTALVDEVAKKAPAGSEHAMAFVKSAIDNTHAGYEQLTKTTQQAVGVLEGHLTTAANQVSQAVEKTVNAKK